MSLHLLTGLFPSAGKDRALTGSALQRVRRKECALVDEFSRRVPHIPLVQHRTGQDDSALSTACFADFEVRPRKLFPTQSPAVTYVELDYRFTAPSGVIFQVNLGKTRLYARIEDPLYLEKRHHSVEQVRASDSLRDAYFRRVFALLKAQSDCSSALGGWMRDFFLSEAGVVEQDYLATIQNFDHNITAPPRPSETGRTRFRSALQGIDFSAQAVAPGPLSLRMTVRPHVQNDGSYAQSVTTVFLGTARGLAFRKPSGKLAFVAPGNAFEKRFQSFVKARASERMTSLTRSSWRRNAEERIWGGPGECEAWFHNYDTFVMKGLEWTLERRPDRRPHVLGTHRNVAAFRSGRHKVAVKAVPFESVGDLVRLIQAHQYVHGVQAPALLAQARAHPELAAEILTAAAGLLSSRDNTVLEDRCPTEALLDRDWSGLFRRNIGPLLHQVTIDYEHKLMLTVLDWSDEGMLSDFHARKRLVEQCSLSHRLRLAANLFGNGQQMLDDDVTHTDLKPENILNQPGPAFHAQVKAREQGWDSLTEDETRSLVAGEPALESDFSGIHFGREGAVDNLPRGEGMPTSIRYSSWKFTSLGLGEGTHPTVLRHQNGKLPRIDALLLEQDIANRGTTAWEIVYGSLVDCIPPAQEAQRIEARQVALKRVAAQLEQAIRFKRKGCADRDVMQGLEIALQQCDNRLLNVVSLRSETIDGKQRITPLFQHSRDNREGLTVWLDPRVIDMLDHLTSDFRRKNVTRLQVAKLYRTAEMLLRAEASRLERADRQTARNRRHKMVTYMQARGLHFNPDCGLMGLEELPRQLQGFANLVARIPDARSTLREFSTTWSTLRQRGASVLEALTALHNDADAPEQNHCKNRAALGELVRSALLREHESLVRLESRVDEDRLQPPFLGLFERRRPRLYRDRDELRFSYRLDD